VAEATGGDGKTYGAVQTGNEDMNRQSRLNRASVVLRHLRQPDEPGSNLQIEVQRVRWRDLSSLRRIRQQIYLNQPNGQWLVGDPFHAGLRQLFPLGDRTNRVAVARGNGHVLGHVVFRVVPPDERWVLESVGANMGVYEAEPIWEELLRYSIVAAGLEGAKRLYARLPVGSSITAAARRTGFAPYAREHVLTASGIPATTPSPRVRRQEPSDVWSIHQLYMAVVPRQVQYGEALTSHHWDVANSHRFIEERTSGWLIEDGHQLTGYVRVQTDIDRHVIELMIDPAHRDDASALLQTALGELHSMPHRNVYAVLRAYQVEILPVLTALGFAPHLEQDVHVKYTTVPIQAPIINGLPVTQEMSEPVGKRVPTFLHGTQSDPVAEPAGSTVRVFATFNKS
jgi:hypothetical protein